MQYPTMGSADGTQTGLLTPNHLLNKRYRILMKLGKGGFGAVYKAEDTQFSNRLVAIKEMSQRGLNSQEIDEAIESFKREAHMLAALRHQNLPRIYDYFSDGGRWYLAMDFIEGETLEEHLHNAKGGNLSVSEAIQIAIQLCTVLDYLHTRQPPIIFRDLTPANIMLTSDGHIYLIDFGIARLFKPGQAKDTTAFGSRGYAAPEQYGTAQTTPRSDIYSLGVILHQMITGNDPTQKPFQFTPPQLSGSSALSSLTGLIMQMIEMDEGKRPTSMGIIKRELQGITAQLAGKQPLSPTQPVGGGNFPPTQPIGGTIPSTIRLTRRGTRVLAIIAAIIAVVVVLSFAIASLSKNSAPSSSQSDLSSSSSTPASTPTAIPSPTPVPTTSTPSIKPGDVLYQADRSRLTVRS